MFLYPLSPRTVNLWLLITGGLQAEVCANAFWRALWLVFVICSVMATESKLCVKTLSNCGLCGDEGPHGPCKGWLLPDWRGCVSSGFTFSYSVRLGYLTRAPLWLTEQLREGVHAERPLKGPELQKVPSSSHMAFKATMAVFILVNKKGKGYGGGFWV